MSSLIWIQNVYYTLMVFLKEVLENINFQIKKSVQLPPQKLEQLP